MKFHLASLVSLSLSAVAATAETFAWKAPVTNLAYEGMETPGISRLEKPPEKSVFFSEGDILWDLKAILPAKFKDSNATPKWIIWNETTEGIVANGTLLSIYMLHRHLGIADLPTHSRHRIDFFRITSNTNPPDFSKNPDSSISAVCRNNQKFSTSTNEGETAIAVELGAVYHHDDDAIDTNFTITAKLLNTPTLEIKSAATFQEATPIWVARSFDGESGLDIVITTDILLSDGTPFSEATTREKAGKSLPVITKHKNWKTVRIGNAGWLVSAWLPIEQIIDRNDANKYNLEMDPFADTPPLAHTIPDGLTEVSAPKILSPHIDGAIWDSTDYLKNTGISLSGDEFSGYDPITGRLFLYSTNLSKLDMFESLMMGLHCCYPLNLAITSSGDYHMRLLARSGQKAVLKSTDTASNKSHEFEFEPTIGESDTFVDLRLLYEEKFGETVNQSLNTATTLVAGKAQEVWSGSSGKMTFKAEIIPTP